MKVLEYGQVNFHGGRYICLCLSELPYSVVILKCLQVVKQYIVMQIN